MEQTVLDKPLSSLVKLDWEKTLYIALIILALATRLWDLSDRVQSHDESIHTKYSWNLYTGQGFQQHPLMHGPFLFHATALSYFLFGDNDFTARLPVALTGVALVAFPYLLRRWLGRAGALVTSFFLLISPSIAYYSRYIRHDIPVILWSLVVFFAIFSYLRDGRERWLYLMAAGVSLMFATKEVAFIYNAIFGLFLICLFAVQALGREWLSEILKPLFLIALAVMVVGLLLLGLGLFLTEAKQPPQGSEIMSEAVGAGQGHVAVLAGGVLAGLAFLAAIVLLLIGMWRNLHDHRVFDLIIVLGTLCLPFLSPLPIKLAGLDPMDYKAPTIYYSGAILGAMLLTSILVGLVWDWRRWSIAAAIHYAIFVILFTTIFTNGTGIATGMVGSLGYWLAQQAVERGSQPWYYYLIMAPLYEFLPLLLTLIAPVYLAVRSAIRNSQPAIRNSYFVPFLLWWTALTWLGYSYAGEKMPWLTVHLALPMILLSGWLVGWLIEGIEWRQVLERRAWLLGLVAPPFATAVVVFISAASAGPFGGYELAQLDVTGRFLGGLVGMLALGAGLGYLVWRSGWRMAVRVLLLVALLVPVFLTIRTAYRFCYINYDYPTEFLVYAHAGPAVNETMRQIEELSRRVAGGPNLIKVAYGSDGSTLWYWQLRDYHNAVFYGEHPSREAMDAPVVIAGREQWDAVVPYMGDDYLVNTYTYLWWPMEDYRNLTWARITHAITDTQTRAALWNIWYDRDYRRYDELTGETHTLDQWPLRSDYRLYIRRDVAAQMWDLSTTGPTEIGPVAPYAEGWRELTARLVFGSEGSAPGQLQGPRGIKVGPDGFIYIADSGNHRIQKFTADGEFVAAWGRQSSLDMETGTPRGFLEPWDVAVASDGTMYVADTWNHRIQKLGAEGNLVTFWGLFGQYGPGDAGGQSAFYGPRGITVGPDGRVYVADTGNKRIQVFESDGRFAFQWGGGGVLEGYLDEPVGIAIGPDGAVYVADTWNRRVQVFAGDGTFLRQWPIAGWDVGLPEEKPYLAVDAEGYVYVTDPGHYRVLVFDSLGNYVLSFGQYGFDDSSFALPMGIAVADDGSIYVTDAHSGRVLVFDPLDFGLQERGEMQ
ncbi:MAG: flippase activity-associated protein Agl23 [Anaerolineae bacterium]